MFTEWLTMHYYTLYVCEMVEFIYKFVSYGEIYMLRFFKAYDLAMTGHTNAHPLTQSTMYFINNNNNRCKPHKCVLNEKGDC